MDGWCCCRPRQTGLVPAPPQPKSKAKATAKRRSLQTFEEPECTRKDVHAENTDGSPAGASCEEIGKKPMARGSRRPSIADYEANSCPKNSDAEAADCTRDSTSTAATESRPSLVLDEDLPEVVPTPSKSKCVRWRAAARRYLLLRRFWMFKPKLPSTSFSAAHAVSEVEAELEQEDQFQALMARRRKTLTSVNAGTAWGQAADATLDPVVGLPEEGAPMPEPSIATGGDVSQVPGPGVEALAPPDFAALAEKNLVADMPASPETKRNSIIVNGNEIEAF